MVTMASAQRDSEVFSRVQAVMDIDFKERHDDRICDVLDDVENAVPNVEIYFDSGTYEFNGSFDDIAKVHETLRKQNGQRRHCLVSAASWSDREQRQSICRRLRNLGMKVERDVEQRFVVLQVGNDDSAADEVAEAERKRVTDPVPWCYLHNIEPLLDRADCGRWTRDVDVQTDRDDRAGLTRDVDVQTDPDDCAGLTRDVDVQTDPDDRAGLTRDVNVQTDPSLKNDPLDAKLQMETSRKDNGKRVRRPSLRSRADHQDGTNYDRSVDEKGNDADAESETASGDKRSSDSRHKARTMPVTMTAAMCSGDFQSDPGSWVMVGMTDIVPSHGDGHKQDVKCDGDPTPVAAEEFCSTAEKDTCKIEDCSGDTAVDRSDSSSSDKGLGNGSDCSVDIAAAGTGRGLRNVEHTEIELLSDTLSKISLSQTKNVQADNQQTTADHSANVSDEKSFETLGAAMLSPLCDDQSVTSSDKNISQENSEHDGSSSQEPLSHPVSLPQSELDVKSPDQKETPSPSAPLPSATVSPDSTQEEHEDRDVASATDDAGESELRKEIKEKADGTSAGSSPDGGSFPLAPGDHCAQQHSTGTNQDAGVEGQAETVYAGESAVKQVRPGTDQLNDLKSEVYNKVGKK